MKISFINPNLNSSVLLNASLGYLQGYIQQFYKTQLIDVTFHRKQWKEYVKTKILQFKPDVIGFTATTFDFYDALTIKNYIKSFYNDAKFILGGVHSTLMHDKIIEETDFDALFIGESEISLKNYLDKLSEGKNECDTKGLWLKEKNGKIHRNECEILHENLDDFPFAAWEHWEMPLYFKYSTHYNKILINASRGCPFNCTFCSNATLKKIMPGKYVRFRSAKSVIDEIIDLKNKYYRQGFRYLFFNDDTFGINKKIFEEMMNLLKTEGIADEIYWQAFARFDSVNEEWISKVQRSGCYLLSFGIEAGNEYIRNKILGKNFSNRQIIDIDKLLVKYKIARLYYYMIGIPGENIETIKQTFALNKALNPEFYSIFVFQPLPKTQIIKDIYRFSGEINESKWLNTGELFQPSFVNTKYLKSKELNHILLRDNLNQIFTMSLGGLKLRRLDFLLDLKEFVRINYLQLGMRIQNLAVKTYFRYRIEDLMRSRGLKIN